MRGSCSSAASRSAVRTLPGRRRSSAGRSCGASTSVRKPIFRSRPRGWRSDAWRRSGPRSETGSPRRASLHRGR